MAQIPNITLRHRINGEFVDVSVHDLFKGKRVVLFGLPGAYTPTCSEKQLPGFESMYIDMISLGIDEVYCTSVNDSFVMGEWFKDQGIRYVKPLPDGNGHLAAMLDMLVTKHNCGFGLRSWRYACIINDLEIEVMNEEEGKIDEREDDPYEVSTPEGIFEYLKTHVVSEFDNEEV